MDEKGRNPITPPPSSASVALKNTHILRSMDVLDGFQVVY
jgi:hypothetical protein